MIGWDLALDCGLPWAWFDDWIKNPYLATGKTASSNAIRDFIYHTTKRYEQTWRKEQFGFNMFDSLAMAIGLEPNLVNRTDAAFVSVELSGTFTRGSMVNSLAKRL